MRALIVSRCGECPMQSAYCQHPDAVALRCSTLGRTMPAECPLRRWSVLVQAAEAPSACEHEPKQANIDVEPQREPLFTQEERDAAMDKALSCLVEDLAQWREERKKAAHMALRALTDEAVAVTLAAARLDAPEGPLCWCNAPSAHQSGWCGRCGGFDDADERERACCDLHGVKEEG